ncbi:uncharacterized protein JCM6883_003166 [Sporobolomyces salmoneus]|uniref:uncharacterized protein n=1 Tax=Sporobolomyces salmoneus TaxID=183962 RepID=UPI0031821231
MSSTAADAAQSLVASFNNKLNKVAPGAVGIQLALMVVIGLAALAAFSVLRPNNSNVYMPKVKYSEDEKRPPKLGKGITDWIPPVLHASEAELMNTIGLDSVAYLRFLRMCRNMFLCIGVLCCAVLIPVNVVYNLKNVKAENRNYLLMLTMENVRGDWLWAHVVGTYLLTLIVFWFIWRNYSAIVTLRWQWFRSKTYQESLHARSLLITSVSKRAQTDQGLAALLSSLNVPYPTTAVHIGRRVGALPSLIEKHNETVKELEEVLTTYFKNPDRLPTNRPTKRIGGWMGMGGKKVDAVDYLTEKIKNLDNRIEIARQQIHEKKAENYGFASFESVPYAHIVAKTLHNKRRLGSHFELAPQPVDIIWNNLTMSDGARMKNKFFGGLLLVLLCGFYTIPLIAVALLANLAALSAYVGFIDTWVNDYSWLFSAFVGIVPPLLTLILQMILPMIIRWVASLQGATTHSQSDRIVTARYSAFLFITQFIIFSLLGVIVQIVSQVVVEVEGHASQTKVLNYLKTIPDNIQSTYMIQSNYWLTVFPLRGASALFDLAQIISLLLVWFRTRMFGRTPREIREWTKPPIFDFPVYYSNHLLTVAVSLVYAPIAPLVVAFGAAAFAVSTWVYKYQLMYVCVSRSETGGRLWNVAINRILMGVILMHLFMALSIGLQSQWLYAIAMAPPAICVLIFKYVLDRKFDNRFRWYIPTEQEMAEVHLHHADARKHRLQKRFGHPSLHEPLFTPMLHKKVQHLLPTIYNGRIGQQQANLEGKSVEQNTIGGLTFAMMEAHDLTVDRMAYLRERDEDAQTVTTAMTGFTPGTQYGQRNGSVDDYFDAKRADYLRHGASQSVVSGLETPDELPFELRQMPVDDPLNASTENLLAYPPSYSSPPQQQQAYGRSGTPMHRSNLSQSSFGGGGGVLPGGTGYDYPPRPESRSTINTMNGRMTPQQSQGGGFYDNPRIANGRMTPQRQQSYNAYENVAVMGSPPTRVQGSPQQYVDRRALPSNPSQENLARAAYPEFSNTNMNRYGPLDDGSNSNEGPR